LADKPSAVAHARPFVVESRGARSLHFAQGEIQSRMLDGDPDTLAIAYTRTMMGCLLFVPDPRRIGMIGLGGGSLAKFCHRHLPRACIAVAEINPQVVALREVFQVPPDGPRFHVVLADGARWVRQAAGRVDLLLVDGFDRDGMPDSLATQRFCDDCRAALQPGGMLVVNLHRDDARFALLVDRLRRSFDGELLVVDDADRRNSIVFACGGPMFATYRPGLVGLPPGLDGAAAAPMLEAFLQVVAALGARHGG
jgi:spermidine synthase